MKIVEKRGPLVEDAILIGRQEALLKVPTEKWRKHLAEARHHTTAALAFMTSSHHLVRNFAVRELPRNHGKPLRPADIARRLNLPLPLITTILEDLQKNLFFLVRNNAGEISWAFPFTADKTPHRLSFSSGERIFAACAEDAIAAPFVQGRLRGENLVVEIETGCAHCGQELHLTIDSKLMWSIKERSAQPLVFLPEIDWEHFTEPNIIDAY